MIYSWADIHFIVNNFQPIPTNTFQLFHTKTFSEPHTQYRIIQTSSLPPLSSYKYQTRSMKIWYNNNLEYRGFYYFSSSPYAVLEDTSITSKNLYILPSEITFIQDEINLFNHLGIETTMATHDVILLHASFIKYKGKAILFTAPCGTGKSTQARLWHEELGSDTINGDRVAIWKRNNFWVAGGVPWCGSSEICKNQTLPLGGIVILRQAPYNEIINLRSAQKLKYLLEQTTINLWNTQMLQEIQKNLISLISDIPTIMLHCKPDKDAVALVAQYLEVQQWQEN